MRWVSKSKQHKTRTRKLLRNGSQSTPAQRKTRNKNEDEGKREGKHDDEGRVHTGNSNR